MPIEPDEKQFAAIAALAGTDADGPAVMLNLNRYRARAAYEEPVPDGLPADVSGHEAYLRYGIVAAGVLHRVGGSILWHGAARQTIIGDDSDRYDEVIAVWYPSVAAFAALVGDPALLAARPHRVAALERAAIIRCAAGPEPVLGVG
jgi:uncharacterized protein (DUF1330 family)